MQVSVVNKINHTLHKLAAATVVFRPIVKINRQGGDMAKTLTHGFPPRGDAVYYAVAGDFGADPIEKDFIQSRDQNPPRRHHRLGLEIVIGAMGLGSTFAPTRKGADFDGRFGIDGKAQDVGGCIGIVIDLTQMIEDGVGLRNFFCG
jgi:hypothetical protein